MASPYAGPSGQGATPDIDNSGISMPSFVPVSGPAITNLTNLGLSPTASPWALLALQQQAQLAQTANSQGAQKVAGATATAEDNLAANGGMSSGARERAQEGGEKDYLSMEQNNQQQMNQNDMQISMNDAQNKLQQLNTAANLEAQNTTAENAYNANMYQQQMQAWAASQQAAATANAGKKD